MSLIIKDGVCYSVPEVFLQPWMEIPCLSHQLRALDEDMLNHYKAVYREHGSVPDEVASYLALLRVVQTKNSPQIVMLSCVWERIVAALGKDGVDQFAVAATRADFEAGRLRGHFAYDLDRRDVAIYPDDIELTEQSMLALADELPTEPVPEFDTEFNVDIPAGSTIH